jgi:hypothetical protein
VRQRIVELSIEPVDSNSEVCSYRVLLDLESVITGARIFDFVEFQVLMDAKGIVAAETVEQLPPVVKFQQGT